MNLDQFRNVVPVSSEVISNPIKFTCIVIGPTIFVAGRYRKLSRDISQTPWILEGERMKKHCVQELISSEICLHFGDEQKLNNGAVIFMGSGREDVDVRCLGKGRPFVLQISDAKRSSLPKEVAVKMERAVGQTKLVSIQHLQLIKRYPKKIVFKFFYKVLIDI